MKRLPQLVALVAITLFIPITVSMPVAAAPVCEIGYTGPDSNNMCTSEEVFKCEVKNENEVTIKNSTDQEVASGTVSVEGNGSGGDATSGSVSNESGTTFNVTIVNGEDKTCAAKAVVPAKEEPTPETPVTPSAPETPEPGRGEMSTPVKPANEATPRALPVTSGSTVLPSLVVATSSITATAAVAFAYRRLHL